MMFVIAILVSNLFSRATFWPKQIVRAKRPYIETVQELKRKMVWTTPHELDTLWKLQSHNLSQEFL